MRKALHSGLPRYVLPKLRKGGRVVYNFNVPTWARKAGCPSKNERLGTDRAAAIEVPLRSCCRPSMRGAVPASRWWTHQLSEHLERSIGFSPSIAPTAVLPSWAPEQGVITKSASGWLADISSKIVADSAYFASH